MLSLGRLLVRFTGGHVAVAATPLAEPEPPAWWWYADIAGGVVRHVQAKPLPYSGVYEVVGGAVFPAHVSRGFLFTSQEEAGREVLASLEYRIRMQEHRRASLLLAIPNLAVGSAVADAGAADAR